jgi:hypothetical protein
MASPYEGPDDADARDPHRRRRRRERITILVVGLFVIAAGIGAAGVYLGRFELPGGSAEPTPTPTPCVSVAAAKTKPLNPRTIKVNVYNATSRAGLAASTAAAMRKRQFAVAKVANDPAKAKVSGVGIVRHGAKASAAAALVAAQLPGAKLVRDKRTSAVVDLVVGQKFKALGPAVKTPPVKKVCAPSASPRTGVPKSKPTTTPR